MDNQDPFERYFGNDANLFYTTPEEREIVTRMDMQQMGRGFFYNQQQYWTNETQKKDKQSGRDFDFDVKDDGTFGQKQE